METIQDSPKRPYTNTLLWHCCGVSWGVAAYGYGASIIATTTGQPTFLAEMGLDTASNASALIGAATALYFVGGVLGCLLVATFADKYGRKPMIAGGATIILISTAIHSGSVNIGTFLAFRLTSGVGGYMCLVAVTLWITEVVPPKHRGIISDINPIFINIGYVSASWVGVGFFYYKDQNSWRAPVAIGCLPCILCLVSMWFVEESPRYLLLQNRTEEAWMIVKKLHTRSGNVQFASEEFEQMKQTIQFERSLKSGWVEMFRRPSYRKRLLMTVFLLFTLVSSGVLVINNYGTIIYGQLGYSNEDQLFLQAGWLVASFASNLVAPLWVDRFACPTLMVIGLAGCCVSVCLEAALVAVYGTSTNKAGLGAAVAATYLFVFFYGGFLDGVTWWYAAESFPTHLRSHGVTAGMVTYATTNIVWLQAAPTAFASIGWRYYLFSIIFTAIGTVIVRLIVQDTLNMPLVKTARLFGDDDLVVASSGFHPFEGKGADDKAAALND